MTKTRRLRTTTCRIMILLGLVLCLDSFADPPSGGAFLIRNQTIESGGGPSASPEFELRGTLGQYEIFESGNGPFIVRGGYWVERAPSDRVFSDDFE